MLSLACRLWPKSPRLALFRLLVKRGPEGYTPTQLVEKLGLPAPTLSFHLKELQRSGLIEMRREGRFLFYSPNFSRMNELIGFLTENCCMLADKDCGPCLRNPSNRRGSTKEAKGMDAASSVERSGPR